MTALLILNGYFEKKVMISLLSTILQIQTILCTLCLQKFSSLDLQLFHFPWWFHSFSQNDVKKYPHWEKHDNLAESNKMDWLQMMIKFLICTFARRHFLLILRADVFLYYSWFVKFVVYMNYHWASCPGTNDPLLCIAPTFNWESPSWMILVFFMATSF